MRVGIDARCYTFWEGIVQGADYLFRLVAVGYIQERYLILMISSFNKSSS